MSHSPEIAHPRASRAASRMRSLLAILASLGGALQAYADVERSACVVSFAGADGGAVEARQVLGAEPIPAFVRAEAPQTGRWCLGGGDPADLAWSRSGNELSLSCPRENGPVAFWVRDPGEVPHERVFVFAWGSDAEGARIRAEVSPAAITGKVQSREGQGMSGVTVSAVPLSQGGCESWASTVTDADGVFVLSGLLAGRYQIVIDAEYAFTPANGSPFLSFPRLPQRPGASGFLVRQVPNLPVALASRVVRLDPFVVDPCASGLHVDAGALAATGEVEIARTEEAPHWFPRRIGDDVSWVEGKLLKFVVPTRDGRADFTGLPSGPYRLNVWRSSEVVSTWTIQLGEGEQTLALDPTPLEEAGSVEGRVEDWDLLPLQDMTLNRSAAGDSAWGVLFYVALIPASEAAGPVTTARAKVDADGRFAVDGLMAGEYRVVGICQIVALDGAATTDAAQAARAQIASAIERLAFTESTLLVVKGERTQVGIRFE